MTATYADKLRDPRWQKRRLEIMARDNWSCVLCAASDSTLNVHHCYYDYGKDPWDYHPRSLLTLCETCHLSESRYTKSSRTDLISAAGNSAFRAVHLSMLALCLRYASAEGCSADEIVHRFIRAVAPAHKQKHLCSIVERAK